MVGDMNTMKHLNQAQRVHGKYYYFRPARKMSGEREDYMEYTEYGLRIGLDELREMLEYAENRAQYDNMEHCLYIKGGERPNITQYLSLIHI